MIDEENIEIRVSNAGLILLWPFLTSFFEQLSMLKNGIFKNQESRNRSVYLLHYLACNRIDFPEYELVLNKLLVGMPVEDPLYPIAELTKEETELAGSLINGFIVNWEKVKNSTANAIQGTFLQREGLLTLNNERNTLQIDKRGVDVLINTIPWNISLIRLPWMQKPLIVEWI